MQMKFVTDLDVGGFGMIEQLLLEMFLGGLTGYVTNDVAIKGLFKKGGVVEQTREEFIHQASALLEEQVLTADVLRERLSLDAVEAALADLLRDFFCRHLPEVLRPYQLGELANYDEMIAGASQALQALWRAEQTALAEIISDRLALEDVLPMEQRQRLVDALLTQAGDVLREGRFGERFLRSWLDSAQGQSGEELHLAELAGEAAAQLASLSRQWLRTLSVDYEREMRHLAREVLSKLDVRELLGVLEQALLERPLREYLIQPPQILAERLVKVLESDEGRRVCTLVAARLVALAAQLTEPVADMLGSEAKALLRPFVQRQLPEIVAGIIEWLRANEEALNQMIAEAIDETAADAASVKALALQLIKESVLQGIFAQHTIINKADEFLRANMTTAEMTEMVMEQILAYGGKVSAAEIVGLLGGEEGALREVIAEFIRQSALQYVRESLAERLDGWLERPLGQVIAVDLSRQDAEPLEEAISAYVLAALSGEALPDAVESVLSKAAERFARTPLGEALPEYARKKAGWARRGQQLLEDYAAKAGPSLERYWADGDEELMLRRVLEMGGDNLPALLARWRDKWRDKPLAELYGSIFTEEWVAEMLPACRKFIQDKLVEAASGSLSQLAESSLNRLSNDELLKLVRDFMGRELKPLNYLGAALGTAVGVVTGALAIGPLGGAALGSAGGVAMLAAGKAAVFGAVGYGTNCAAIKGLFWPYRPVGGIRALQGVVPKQQERFANSLGQMVDRYVLNEDILQEILVGQSERWQAMGTALGNDPVVAADILRQVIAQREKIAQGSYRGLVKKVGDGLPSWLDRLAGRRTDTLLPLDKLALSVDSGRLSEKCRQAAVGACYGDKPLAELVSAEQILMVGKRWLHRQIPRYLRGERTLAAEPSQRLQERAVGDVLPQRVMAKLKGVVQEKGQSLWESPALAAWIAGGINHFLEQQTLGEAFGGRLTQWAEENISWLLQVLINEMIGYLARNQAVITEVVQQQIKTRLSFVQLVGYTTMDGDELVAEVVKRLVTVKLPLFLAVKQQEVGEVLLGYWREKLAPMSPRELHLEVTAEAAAQAIRRIGAHPQVAGQWQRLLADGLDYLAALPLKGYLSVTVLADGAQIREAFAAEIAYAKGHLLTRWRRHEREIFACLEEALVPFLRQELARLTVSDLLLPCAGVLEKQVDWKQLLAMGGLDDLAADYGEGVLRKAGQMKLADWLDWAEFSDALVRAADTLLASAELEECWQRLVSGALTRLAEDWEHFLPAATREQAVGWIVQGFLASLRTGAPAVLEEMNLAQVTSVQVQAMDARELEKLVHGFAGGYFSHIQNMGWLGAGFAIPGILLSWLLC